MSGSIKKIFEYLFEGIFYAGAFFGLRAAKSSSQIPKGVTGFLQLIVGFVALFRLTTDNYNIEPIAEIVDEEIVD